MKELFQKKWGEYLRYQLADDALHVEYKSQEKFTAFKVNYDQIQFDEIIVRYRPGIYATGLFVSIFINALLILVIFQEWIRAHSYLSSGITVGMTIGFAAWGKQLFKFDKLKALKGNTTLNFFYFKKEQARVDEFIGALKKKKADFMRQRYLQPNEYLPPEDQRSQLVWLFDQGYISKQELENALDKIGKKTVIRGFDTPDEE